MHAGGAMTYIAVDRDGFPVGPKESTDVVSVNTYTNDNAILVVSATAVHEINVWTNVSVG